ncbi:hypothetical protein PHLGIDRAFT_128090 [Phlebiopsis gigantea 11061_1 CR5-6]|uniref:BAR-domain-containing protein n=1 Tax=Phlebiopsis gigantea (strain 11061_1 CR5-6) TaxID=745531 RepID=A0A0C3PKE3_PHLG1|nr:hypothetical protein PHLGIDRAFT_128090 [Phlebiopsis gigantea 11061_1 CR5-6]
MASKQLGKLRQWAGEVISTRDRTVLSDEFRELEHDVELRRRGLWKLHVASEDYHHALSKKKLSEAVDSEDKLLPIDALGVVMIQHGEEFGDDSAFGTSLVGLGRAHCQVATLQEAFSVLFHETYFASVQRFEDDIKEYQSQRKRLDSRRLTYDAAASKLEKIRSGKKEKEKDRLEAEDEFEHAKSRYEECAEDVRARMYAIQENELEQLRDLTSLLDNEMQFVEQYLEVLRDVKANWVDESTLAQMESSKRPRPLSRPVNDSRFSSLGSKKSISRRSAAGSDETDDEDEVRTKSSLKKSGSVKKGDSGSTSRPPSRPQSRAERKRADSTVSIATETGKEKEKSEKSKRMSVAGWMGSITGRGKKEKTDSLMQDQDEDEDSEDGAPGARPPKSRSASVSSRTSPTKTKPTNSTNASPVIPGRNFKLPVSKKTAVALHDFNASSTDELSFRVGDQIAVQNEVLDGWWMGELNGKTGLFPTTYTEIINASSSSLVSKPRLPPRPPATQTSTSASRISPIHFAESLPKRAPPKWVTTQATGDSPVSDNDHPFGDHFIASSRSPLNGAFYAESITSSADDADESEDARLVPGRGDSDDGPHDYRATSANSAVPPPRLLGRKPSAAKKAPPPPPPPRRGSTNMLQAPPIPGRGFMPSGSSTRSNSTNASFVSLKNDESLTSSPFD